MFFSKKIFFLFLIFCCVQTLFAQNCDNVGFENGTTSGWICTSGTFGSIDSTPCDASLPIILKDGACMNQGGMNGNLYPDYATENRHILMSDTTGTDPNSLNNVPYVAPDSLFPSGVNNYSFRLGNGLGTDNSALALAESIKFQLTVTAQNAGLTYLYAAFLREALPAVHSLNQAPRFEVRITEKKNGGDSLINCGYYQVIAGATNNFLKGAGNFTGVWKYTNWTKVALDLTEYIGKQLTIEFRTMDCFPGQGGGACKFRPGPHSAYAYIDLYCAPVSIVSPPICGNQATIQLCAPPGYATYQWPANAPGIVPPLDKQCVTILHPKVGNNYQVNMVVVPGGCVSRTTISLNGVQLKIKDTTVCKGSPPFLLNAMPAATGNYTFKWVPATHLSCTDCPTPVFTAGATTTYTITMSDKNTPGCISEKTITVRVEDLQVNAGAGNSLCAGSSILLNGSISGSTTSAVWTGGTGSFSPCPSTLTATYTPSASEIAAGSVTLSLTSNTTGSCPASVSKVTYTIYPKPMAAFIADPSSVSIYDPTVQFIDQSSTDVIFWKWDLGENTTVFPGIKNPVHHYSTGASGIYRVKLVVRNQYGCEDSVQHPVEVRPEFVFYIPNAFTPADADGTNDTFFGKGRAITKYHLWIFDRWGNMVFQTENINEGWNGRVHNDSDIAQQDVYAWKVQLTDVSGKEHQYIGTVTLLR